jgi:hypothetical protein
MDPRDQDQLFGAITAQNVLLEHLWAFCLTIVTDDDAERTAVIRRIRDKMLREFDLPSEDDPGEGKYAASQHAISILEEFWERMEKRCGSLPE